MANDALKAAAKKELLRRQAQAELARREASKTQAAPEPQNSLEGTARAYSSGFRSGLEGLAGYVGDAQQTSGNVAAWLAEKAGFPEYAGTARKVGATIAFPGIAPMPSTGIIRRGTNSAIGEGYKPQTTLEEYANTAGQFTPGAFVGPGGIWTKAGGAIGGALGSEAAGQASKGKWYEPYARMAGGLLGGVTGGTAGSAADDWAGFIGAWTRRGMDEKAGAEVADMIKRTGMTPEQAMKRLDELGPEGMLADVAQREAAQTAYEAPAAGELMTQRVAARREAASGRIKNTLDDAFGPFQDPYAFRKDIVAQKDVVNPEYTTALNSLDTLLPSSVKDLDPKLANLVSGMSLENRNAMGGFIGQIDDALSAGTPKEQATRLLDLRKRLDKQIIRDPRGVAMLNPAERASQGVVKQARRIVGDILDNNVPGIAEIDAKHAPLSAQQTAFDYGRKEMFGGGTGAITPAENQARLLQMTDPERLASAQGARATIEQTLTNARGNPGLKVDRMMARDWNSEKAQQLLGKNAAKRLANTIDAENTFTETSNLIEPTRNSRTAILSGPSRWSEGADKGLLGDVFAAGTGAAVTSGSASVGLLSGGAFGARKIVKALFGGKADERLVKATADKLTKMGPEARAVLAAIIEASKTQKPNLGRNIAGQGLLGGYSASIPSRAGLLSQPSH